MKKLILLALLAFSSIANAASYSTNLTAQNAGTVLFTNSATIYRITVVNSTTTNDVIRFFDANWASLQLTNSGTVTNFNSYLTNVSVVFTNYTGIIQTNIYTNQLVTVPTTNGPSTNQFRLVAVVGSTASNTSYYLPLNPIAVSYGLAASNVTAANVTVEYNSTR